MVHSQLDGINQRNKEQSSRLDDEDNYDYGEEEEMEKKWRSQSESSAQEQLLYTV